MRSFVLAACCAAMGLFVWSCSGDSTSAGTSSGTTSSGTTASSGGSTSSGAGGGGPGAIIDMFCNAVSSAACEADYACCTIPNLQYPPFGDVESCKKYFPQSQISFCTNPYTRPGLEKMLQTGEIVFDKVQLELCLALLKSISAGGEACVQPPLDVAKTTCVSAFRGQIAPNEACPTADWGWEQAPLSCKDGVCKNGVCVPFLKVGDACPVSNCCDTEGCNWLKGEWCYGDPGVGGAGGGGGGTPAMGVCAPKREVGDACYPANNLACRSHSCDETISKCVPPDPPWHACASIF